MVCLNETLSQFGKGVVCRLRPAISANWPIPALDARMRVDEPGAAGDQDALLVQHVAKFSIA
jgi:hypothetical protein